MILRHNIRGVIVDLDGVILDSMGFWNGLGARYLRSCGAEPVEGLDGTLFSMSMEQGAAWLREHYLPEKSAEEIGRELQELLRDFYFYEVEAKPGARELLQALFLDGIPVTAATTSPGQHVERALERNGLNGYIRRIFTGAEIGSGKDSPEIYHAAAEHMGLRPEEIWVFEDSLFALRTAKEAGYHTVGLYDACGEPDQKGLEDAAEIYVRELWELKRVL